MLEVPPEQVGSLITSTVDLGLMTVVLGIVAIAVQLLILSYSR